MSDSNEQQQQQIEVEISTTTSTTEIILLNENEEEQSKTTVVDENNVIIVKAKKKVTFPEEIIKGYSDPPKRWIPGSYSTSDLLESYCKACDKQKCKPLSKLLPLLKALQDIDCERGEKVNVLSLKNEKLDLKQIESLEEIFKRLSFKSIDLEGSVFDADDSGATMFEILDYYDTCEKLILTNNRSVGVYGLQLLSRLIRKSCSLENLEMRGYLFPDYYHFTYFARAMRLTTCLKILHLDNSNIQGKFLISLLNAIKDNEYIKEIYLPENKLSSSDGMYIGGFLKENRSLELLDIRSNQLNDIGLSHICSGLSEQADENGLKTLSIANNNISFSGISYLTKAIIHNRSLTHLNISQNNLTNEGLIALKDSLISNKMLNVLILQKVKLTDEGVIALAEYIAETQSLIRLDIRENDIRLGGVMALASSLKFNKTLTRIEIDKDLKRDSNIKDYVEQTKRLIQDINESCNRNKQYEAEKEEQLKAIMSAELKLVESCSDVNVISENNEEEKESDYDNQTIRPAESDDKPVNSVDEYFDEVEDYHVINHASTPLNDSSNNSSFECVDFNTSSSSLTTVISTNNKKFSICAVDSNDNSLIETPNNNRLEELEVLNLAENNSFNLNEQESLINAKLKVLIESNQNDDHSSQFVNNEIQHVISNIIDIIVFNFEKESNPDELLSLSPSSSSSSLSPNELIVNHSDILITSEEVETTETKPFFTSKLTNSQLSEELSSEIGLE